MSSRNIDVLEHLIRYCDEIDEARSRLGDSIGKLESDRVYKSAVAMCIIQIGELITHLSDDFKAMYNEMPWQDIKRMRNIAAHHYGSFDTKKLWETITEDIPALREYCEMIVSQYKVLEQEAVDEQDEDILE